MLPCKTEANRLRILKQAIPVLKDDQCVDQTRDISQEGEQKVDQKFPAANAKFEAYSQRGKKNSQDYFQYCRNSQCFWDTGIEYYAIV